MAIIIIISKKTVRQICQLSVNLPKRMLKMMAAMITISYTSRHMFSFLLKINSSVSYRYDDQVVYRILLRVWLLIISILYRL